MTDTTWLPLAAGSGAVAVLGVAEIATNNWFHGLSQLGVAGGMIGLWYYKTRYTDPAVAKSNAEAVTQSADRMAGSIDKLSAQIESDNIQLRLDLREQNAQMFKLLSGFMTCPSKREKE